MHALAAVSACSAHARLKYVSAVVLVLVHALTAYEYVSAPTGWQLLLCLLVLTCMGCRAPLCKHGLQGTSLHAWAAGHLSACVGRRAPLCMHACGREYFIHLCAYACVCVRLYVCLY